MYQERIIHPTLRVADRIKSERSERAVKSVEGHDVRGCPVLMLKDCLFLAHQLFDQFLINSHS